MKEKNPNAVALGRLGGTKRWSKIPKKDRSKIMSKVAKARYTKKRAKNKVGVFNR